MEIDWATLFKDYPLLIPAIATVVAAILGFFFIRWNSTHNKNLEIQKKEYDKRSLIRDSQIHEVRDYVNTVSEMIYAFTYLYHILKEPKDFTRKYDTYLNSFPEFPKQLKEIFLKTSSPERLKDKELEKLHSELKALLLPIIKNYREVFYMFETKGKVNTRDINLDELVFPSEASELITKIKIRLDELANKVP